MIKAILFTFPVLWVIGGERLLSPIVIIPVVLCYLSVLRKDFYKFLPKRLVLFIVFLLLYGVSIFQVHDPSRFLTFAWDLSLYVTFLFIIVGTYFSNSNEAELQKTIQALIYFSFFVHLLAVTYYIFGNWRFNSLLGYILPSSIKSTSMGQIISIRSVGKDIYFLGIESRLTSIFSTSIHYGAFTLMTLPIILYKIKRSINREKAFYFLYFFFSIVMVFTAQARTAMIICAIIIGIYYLIKISDQLTLSPGVLFSGIACIAIFFVGSFVFVFFDEIAQGIDMFFVLTRAGSLQQRLAVYTNTWTHITNNPILGYGTQLSTSYTKYPLGSHNWYMSILFKHGIIAFTFFITFYFGLIITSFRLILKNWHDKSNKWVSTMFFSLFFAHSILTLTIEPIVDPLHLYILGVLIGSFLAYSSKISRHDVLQGSY